MSANQVLGAFGGTVVYNVNPHLFVMPEAEKSKPVYLNQEHVRNCCGVNWLAGFPHPVVDKDPFGNWSYNLDKELNKHLVETVRKDIKKQKPFNNSVTLVVINHIQHAIYDEMLQEEGFTPILENAYHNGHGHTLFIYHLNKHERKTPTSHR